MNDPAAVAVRLADADHASDTAAARALLGPFPLPAPANEAAVADGVAKRDAAVAALDALAARLNGEVVQTERVVPGVEASQFLVKNGVVAAALFVAQDPGQPLPLRVACQTVRDAVLNNQFPAYDLSAPEDKAIVDADTGALIAAGVMTTQQRDALYALAAVQTPFWQTVGERELDHGDILVALGGSWDDLTVPNVAAAPEDDE